MNDIKFGHLEVFAVNEAR